MESESNEKQRLSVTLSRHQIISQTHSTNTFHKHIPHIPRFLKHIPRNSHKNNRDPHEQEWHLPLCLCFVLLYMVLFKTKLPVGALLIEAGDCPAGCHCRCRFPTKLLFNLARRRELFVDDRTTEPNVSTVIPSARLPPLSPPCGNSGCSCCSCSCCNCSTPIVMLWTSGVKTPLLDSSLLLGLVSGNTEGIFSGLTVLVLACRLCFKLEGRAFCLVLTTTGDDLSCGGGCCRLGKPLGEPLVRRGGVILGGVG
jgi:hypothetical protein